MAKILLVIRRELHYIINFTKREQHRMEILLKGFDEMVKIILALS